MVFALVVRRGEPVPDPGRRLWGGVALGALLVALAQTLSLALMARSLDVAPDALLARLPATQYFHAAMVRVLAAVLLGGLAVVVSRRPRAGRGLRLALVGSVVALVVSTAWTGHGAARLGDRSMLLLLSALHQLAASIWVGGLVHLVVAVRGSDVAPAAASAIVRRFSTLALVAVGGLIAGGVGLSIAYADGPRGLIGTTYGLMVLTKIVLLGGLLALGGLNLVAIRDRPGAPSPSLRRVMEVELGLGFTVLFAAASLTSLPPAVDVVADRAAPAEVLERFTPRWPSFTSPPIEAVPVDREAPRTDADRAWSEYNHHVSGLFVLVMGGLALLARAGVRAARHWPLLFVGLAAFMVVRSDPEAWPLGGQSFWAGMTDLEVSQHRIFVLIVGAALVEWMVRTGRLRAPGAALVFPLLCAVGGGLLLAHGHASQDVKGAFLMEATHAPLGVLGLVVGWGRWLEIRLPPPASRLPGWLSASALTAVGVLLLLYRES